MSVDHDSGTSASLTRSLCHFCIACHQKQFLMERLNDSAECLLCFTRALACRGSVFGYLTIDPR